MPRSCPRRLTFRLALLLTLPGLAAPLTAFATPGECLLDLNDRLLTPHHVSLRLADGRVRAGQLEFIDTRERYLLFTPEGAPAAEPLRLRPAEIRAVEWSYHAPNEFYIFGGLLGGAVVGLAGVAIASHTSDAGGGRNPIGGDGSVLALGMGVGALAGGLLGLIVPLLHRHDVRVECAEAAGR